MSWWTLVKVLVSAGVLLYLGTRFPLGDAVATLAAASPAWFAAALLLKGLAIGASALVWHGLLDPATRPPLRGAARTYFASLHAGLAGPGNLGGDAYRVAVTGGRSRADEALAAVLGERALGLVGLAGLAAAGAWLVPEAAPWRFPLTALALLGLGGLAAGVAAGPALAARLPHRGFLTRTARHALLGVARLRQPRVAARAVTGVVALPLLTAAATWAAFAAVGASPSLAFTLFAANAAALVVLLPVSIQGVGVREGVFLALFTGLAGVPAHAALAASLLSLAATVALGLAGGVFLWLPARSSRPASAGAPGEVSPSRERRVVLRAALPLPVLLAAGDNGLGNVGDAFEKLLALLRSLMGGLAEEMTYLPPGSAPLVMIFGGLFVLAMALVLSMLQPFLTLSNVPRPNTAGTGGVWPGPAGLSPPSGGAHGAASPAVAVDPRRSAQLPPLPANLVTPQPGAGRSFDDGLAVGKALPLGDIDAVLDAAERLGLGEAHLVSVEPHQLLVRFSKCQTCRLRPAVGQGGACEFERGFLEGAMRGIVPRAQASESFCSRASDGACEFEIHTGG